MSLENRRAEALAFIQTLPWGNAAGCCKDEKRVRQYSQAGVKHVTYGSIRAKQHQGNPDGSFGYDRETGEALNNWNIPDPGIEVHLKTLPQLKRIANENGSELWVSISGGDKFDPQEYHDMARTLIETESADGVEGNFSCPNKPPSGRPVPIVCYDIPRFREGIEALRKGAGKKPVKAKISPITEAGILYDLVMICIEYWIEYMVAANTIGNCYIEKEDGRSLIVGNGGLSGPTLRPLIRGMLRMMKPWLAGTDTKVIAAGGIEMGIHAHDYLRLGAHGFAFNTALTKANYNPDVIKNLILGDEEELIKGLVDVLVDKGLPEWAW